MNNSTLSKYIPLFENLTNPNECPVTGTFFTQDLNSDPIALKKLQTLHHELAVTSADGNIPKSRRQWVESLFESFEKLYDADIKQSQIKGAQSPNLYMGGSDELQALRQFGMEYEASCIQRLDKYSSTSMLWPFSYDYVETLPHCGLGHGPNVSFPGIWQFMLPEFTIRNHKCSTLSSCSPYIQTTADAFTLIYDAFERHYETNRAPMTLYVDPQWLSKAHQVEGLRQFMETISRFTDTWLVTLSQALEWVRYPVPMYKTVKFMPWECSDDVKKEYRQYSIRNN